MVKLFAFLAAALLSAVGFGTQLIPAEAQPSSARLVVNEVFDSATPAGEFFELYNGTSAAVDLSEYAIYNRDGSDPLGQLETRTIPAGGFLTVPASALGGTIGGPTGLVHGGDFLALVVTGTTGTVVDLVNWGNANPNWPNYPRFSTFFFSPAPIMPPADLYYSLQRWPDGHDSDLGADWRVVERSPSGPSCADPYEPDGSPRYSAPVLKPGQSQLHRFCPAGELDYIGIYTSPGLIYTIETTDVGDLVDTAIVLEDSTGLIRSTGTGRADARGERIVYWSFGGGPFFVRVADAAGRGGTGPAFLYSISLGVEPVPTPIPTSTVPPFSDVRPTDYFYQAVMDLTRRGIISGYSDGTFRPYNSTTRAQLVKIVVGVELWEINTTGGPHFSDVPPDHAFYNFVETAFHRRVIAGYADDTFRPFNNVTRGQLAKIVVTSRRWDLANPKTPTFVDVPPNNPFFHYVETAFRRGIVGGYNVPGTPWYEFRWGSNATRGQVARVVYQTALAPPPTAQAAIPTPTK